MVAENESAKNADLLKRAEKLLLELVRLVVTGFVVVFMMHFLYTDAVIYDPYVGLHQNYGKISDLKKINRR